MVNPGTFKGLRKEFLDSQKDLYAAAVQGNHVSDTVADIQRRYFKRFPVTLSHSEEPTKEFLDAVDDDAPDAELKPPELDGLDDNATARAVRVHELRIAELKMRMDVSNSDIIRQLSTDNTVSSKSNAGFSTNTTKRRAKRRSLNPAQTTPWPF